jgi:tetratricopeptide (TPR) repeat protein
MLVRDSLAAADSLVESARFSDRLEPSHELRLLWQTQPVLKNPLGGNMKRLVAVLTVLTGISAAMAQEATRWESKLSPAQQAIEQAQKLIDKNGKDNEAYNALALALARRARETSDPNFYLQGEEALQKSFAISPNNYDGKRIQVWLLLGKHEFAEALAAAKPLNKKMPDDVMVWGFMTDANVELGDYSDAEKSAQQMLNLRPGYLPALTRAAYLRELFGDVEGAIELMQMALESTPPSESEDRAWITTQMAHLKLGMGKVGEAESLLQQALTMFPGYHYALGNLAKVRIQQQRYADAVILLQQRYSAAPHAENLFELAVALKLDGRPTEANRAFAEFERKSLAESTKADNSNHELIMYYADYANQPAKALEVATSEYARRHDVLTVDCYAWALHVNGRDTDALGPMVGALAVGIQDAKIFRHAAEIASKTGNVADAQRYIALAAELEGKSPKLAAR